VEAIPDEAEDSRPVNPQPRGEVIRAQVAARKGDDRNCAESGTAFRSGFRSGELAVRIRIGLRPSVRGDASRSTERGRGQPWPERHLTATTPGRHVP